MCKTLVLSFDNSEEETKLYKWLTNKNDMNSFIINSLMDDMNKSLSKAIFTEDELNEINNMALKLLFSNNKKDSKTSQVSSKDLNEMFDDDSFWD